MGRQRRAHPFCAHAEADTAVIAGTPSPRLATRDMQVELSERTDPKQHQHAEDQEDAGGDAVHELHW